MTSRKSYLMLHHSNTMDSNTVSWGAIEKYHLAKGWADIGYHYGVERIGDSFYAVVGRPVWQDAAACYQSNMNQTAVHVCCVGNYDLQSPPPGLIDVLVKRIILPTLHLFQIPIDHIVGHRNYAPYKSCPGVAFSIEGVRDHVRASLG